MMASLENLRIILVEPSGPTNLGSVCRAMANFGLRDLVLVAPRCSQSDPAAIDYAVHGRHVLDAARVVATLPEALADVSIAFAATSKLGMYQRQAGVDPRAAAAAAVQHCVAGRAAIAFGREDRGLLTTELLHFDRVVSIPAAREYPVLNLAAAVTVLCYEAYQALLAHAGRPALPTAIDMPPEIGARKQVMFRLLFENLERIGFFRGQQYPDHLRHALRSVLGRTDMTINEVDVFIGMARQIGWAADRLDAAPPSGAPPSG